MCSCIGLATPWFREPPHRSLGVAQPGPKPGQVQGQAQSRAGQGTGRGQAVLEAWDLQSAMREGSALPWARLLSGEASAPPWEPGAPFCGKLPAGLPLPARPAPGHPQCLWPLSSLQLKGGSGVPSLVSFLGRVTTDPRLRTWASLLPSQGKAAADLRPAGVSGPRRRRCTSERGWGPRPWF